MGSLTLFVVAFGRSQHCQEGQRPNPFRPRNRCQQHQAQPAQAAGFHEMTVAGPYWIPVYALGPDLGAPATLNGIIQAQHNRPKYGKGSYQQTQKHSAGFTAGPDRTIENPMKILKVLLAAQSHNPQNGGHRPLPWSKDGTKKQNLRLKPNSLGEKSSKAFENRDIFCWQSRHSPSSSRRDGLAYSAFC